MKSGRSMFGTTADTKPTKSSQQTSVNTLPLQHQQGADLPLPHAPVQRTASSAQPQPKTPPQEQPSPPQPAKDNPPQQTSEAKPASQKQTSPPSQAPPGGQGVGKQASPTHGETGQAVGKVQASRILSANEPISMSQLQAAAEGIPIKKPVQETKPVPAQSEFT